MHDQLQEYRLPLGGEARLVAALGQVGWRLAAEAPRAARVRLLDSFDWGAYLAGAVIEEREQGNERWLSWHDLRGVEPPLAQPIAQPPGFPRDLPPGPLKERVLAAVGVRRLLVAVELEVESRTIRLLDDEEKTRARLVIETYRPAGGCGAGSRPEPDQGSSQGPAQGRGEGQETAGLACLFLEPLKGYQADAREVAAWLSDDLALAPAARPLWLDVLGFGPRPAGGYSSKLSYRLDPKQRADSAARQILLGLLDTIEVNIEGARANVDSEFLHDLRVATRRTRAALTQIPGVLPPQVEADFKARFAWLQQVTGPVRDLDVYLLDFDIYQASLPAAMGPDLEPLRAYILAHYGEEQGRLSEALGSASMTELVRDWRQVLEAPTPAESAPANAARPIKGLADERLWRLVRRVRREGQAITRTSAPEELHELRKSCKKLRYLMEFFQSLYPDAAIASAIRLLKTLLDNLGSFQDLAVQAHHLREMAVRMHAQGGADTQTLLAIGALVADLLRRREAARSAFSATFAGFVADDGKALFRELFHGGAPTGLSAALPTEPQVSPGALVDLD